MAREFVNDPSKMSLVAPEKIGVFFIAFGITVYF